MKLPALFLACVFGLAACGGGGGGDSGLASDCSHVVGADTALLAADVDRITARAIAAADALAPARPVVVAVVDRVGNVLGVYRKGDDFNVTVASGRAVAGGLEGASVPSSLAAISKAITGAYLSSSGNAFSTRTAGFIIQEHFVPGARNFSSGPLYGVQFSQLGCGDLVQRGAPMGTGPRRAPLGLSADPGGFPLYVNGRVVGGIGVTIEGDPYGIDLNTADFDNDLEERIAQSASQTFAPETCIRANRITAGGVTLRYSDSDALLVSTNANSTDTSGGAYISVADYFTDPSPRDGRIYGSADSGFQADTNKFLSGGSSTAFLLSGQSANALLLSNIGSGTLSDTEVEALLGHAISIARSARAQIRRPLNSFAEVTISVVDADGLILGIRRTPDAPIFGVDVSLQKARTAAFFSKADAAQLLSDEGHAVPYLTGGDGRQANLFFASYLADGVFAGDRAFSGRAIGNIHRPYFPDGIVNSARGPLSVPFSQWSPFNVGLQLDLVTGKFLTALDLTKATNTAVTSCTEKGIGIDNGIQIFPGSVPIYRNGALVGAIGVSGDGVDQDDMIAFLAVDRASKEPGATLANAPSAIRADQLAGPTGDRLRYVQCPQSPFLNSAEQDVCSGR